jgi:hypothetical protein
MLTVYKAPDEFLVKLYRWARADFQREIDEGFPLLRGIDGRTTYGLLGLMESLPAAERLAFVSFLLRRFHQRAAEVLGERETGDERRFQEMFSNTFQTINHLEQQRLEQARGLGPLLEGKERDAIIKRVREELHEPHYVWPRSGPWKGMSFEVEKGAFRIVTRLYTRMSVSLCYDHAVQNKGMEGYNQNMAFYCDRLSVYSWLGVSGQTMWMGLRAGDVERVASHVVRLSRHFIEGVGALLDDSYLSA